MNEQDLRLELKVQSQKLTHYQKTIDEIEMVKNAQDKNDPIAVSRGGDRMCTLLGKEASTAKTFILGALLIRKARIAQELGIGLEETE